VANARIIIMVVSLALSVLIGLVVARGGAESAVASTATTTSTQGGEILVGLSLDTLKEARWQADRDLFVAKAKELGATTLVQSANSDDTRQMQDIEALISRGVRALVIVAHDSKTMARAVDIAHKSKIPVIAYDRMIRDADVDVYVSFDNERVGEQQAEYLVKHLPGGKGKIVRIHGAPTDDNAKTVKKGQDKVLEPYLTRGDIQVVHEDWAEEWKPEAGKKIVNAAITRVGRGFDGVLAANDGTAGGAIQALTEEGIAGKVIVTGQDAELPALQRIMAGTQTVTVYKPIKDLARIAADTAVKLAKREVVIAKTGVPNGKLEVPAILSTTTAVDKSNLADTVVKDGFHTKEEIERGTP
jgi:D-xylose transport system substrate-binding protein